MSIDDLFERYPDAKLRLMRAAAAALVASGRSFKDYSRLSFRRRGDHLAVLGDGQPIVDVELAVLLARTDA